jgi:hypothetical protein
MQFLCAAALVFSAHLTGCLYAHFCTVTMLVVAVVAHHAAAIGLLLDLHGSAVRVWQGAAHGCGVEVFANVEYKAQLW